MSELERVEGVRHELGAVKGADGLWNFTVWAPKRQSVRLRLAGTGGAGESRMIAMEKDARGYFHVKAECEEGWRYLFELDGSVQRPDPASRFQPAGVHAHSETVDLGHFDWTDENWKPPTLEKSIFYELHVGTYTQEGTFDALERFLPQLADLGVTTIEIMPVAQFPGARNWGYDGVYPYAVQNSYGGPHSLQRFVNAAHARGLAVALDVVYNHLGPEGNYLGEYAPYFSGRYKTPWGDAINYDGPDCDGVRRYFIENALYWFEHYHIDALRLDAIHGIFDFGALHVLDELQQRTEALGKRLGRELILIAESDLNDARVLRQRAEGGYALPAQWSDDFHHSLRTLLTDERQGYYADFGRLEDLATTIRDGWAYQWRYSKFRRRHHGNSPRGLSRSHFVVFNQNHDQVGNRAVGDRLSQGLDFESLKLAAAVTLLSPFVPLLFMGEEHAETSPFLYFTHHGDKDLIEAVRKGRRHEFAEFGWAEEEIPDPHEEATFAKSKLRHGTDQEPHKTMREFYKALITYRRANDLGADRAVEADGGEEARVLRVVRATQDKTIAMYFNFSKDVREVNLPKSAPGWTVSLYSAEKKWGGLLEVAPNVTGSKTEMAGRSALILEAPLQ